MEKKHSKFLYSKDIKWFGSVPHDELRNYYNASNLVIIPSRSETFGLVCLEAVACETPVLFSDTGRMRDFVHIGKTGMISEDTNSDSFSTNIREFIKNAGMDSKIELKMGDARQILKDFNNPIDLVFMDADKSEYLDYYKLIVPLLKKGGIIIADNVLWSGKVISDKPDRESIALNEFNDYVNRDKSVEQVMLTVRDGLYVIRKL